MYFGNFIGNGAELRHRSERISFKIHVQSGNNDSYSVVGQLFAHVDQSFIKELCLIDTHDFYFRGEQQNTGDRKSTRLNSSHANISYAVFCLKKKKNKKEHSSII